MSGEGILGINSRMDFIQRIQKDERIKHEMYEYIGPKKCPTPGFEPKTR